MGKNLKSRITRMGESEHSDREQLTFLPLPEPFKAEAEWRATLKTQSNRDIVKAHKEKSRRSKVNPKTYQSFYDEGREFGESIYEQTDEKLSLLVRYFPKQFGDNGREPLKGKQPWYIGAKFNRLLEAAKQKAGYQ
ncbi:hypothetical protein HYT25_03395 [Candidatus Pacearchaeota archaeon]|nr:hypothetical protein [Candidatus Pacearchaeota archaeon]